MIFLLVISDLTSPEAMDRLRLRALLVELDRLEASLFDVEGVIAAFITERAHLRANLDRLLSIPGVNLVVGAGLLAARPTVCRSQPHQSGRAGPCCMVAGWQERA
jgi:hypothetical protein